MVKSLLSVVLFCASVLTLSAQAETLQHAESGLQFDVPDGWKHESAEDLLVATNGDGDLVVLIFVAKADSAEEFLKGMGEELGKIIKDAKITEGPKEEKINELTQEFIEGTGKPVGRKAKGEEDAAEVDWHMTVVHGGKKLMVAVAFGNLTDDGEKVAALYNSIKKIK
ncbi:MAG TPA: hypothetical protein VEJ63_06650 [Planctomycetota bacterium]|nr:hypothetical protein [Planctomycetota bacterium]